MSSRRPAALGGLVFAVFSIGALVVMPPPPDADSSASTLRHYFVAHASAVRTASVLSALAALALLPFFATLRNRLVSPAGDALYAAGAVTVAVGVLGSVLQVGLVNAQSRLPADGLLTFFGVERMVFYVGPAVVVSLVGLTAAVGYRNVMPSWLAALSALLGVVALVGGIATMVSESTGAGAIGLIGFLLTIVWTASSAVVLLRESAAAPSGAKATAVAAY